MPKKTTVTDLVAEIEVLKRRIAQLEARPVQHINQAQLPPAQAYFYPPPPPEVWCDADRQAHYRGLWYVAPGLC